MRIQPLLRILLAAATATVPAVGLAPHPAQAAPADCATTTPATVAGYLDTAMPRLLSEHRVPGAVVSVVSSGQTVFAKGYGVADTARGTPFDASGTLVQVGSVTKLFTWTAVMQQVEAGRLDLHADVNRYLKGFQLPATFPEPVTLLDLMDHTAGFEDSTIGSYARTAADVPPLRDYLASHVPARIRPPGQISAYSNYGAGLAGYIVAQVSGEPYDEYVRRHLLDPLGMSRSTVSQPVPAALAGDLAQSYDSDADPPAPIPLRYDNTPPDGALSTTAMDMANFMTAELDGGRYGDASILSAAGMAQMHERSFAADPRLDGYAHGFMEKVVNGHRVLMHDGGEEGFRSAVMLVPGCGLGVFLSMNGTGGDDAAGEFTDGFFGRFAPPSAVSDPVSDTGPTARDPLTVAAPRAGFYLPTRHNQSSVEKLTNLLGALRLTVATDGTVHFGGKAWVSQGGGVYRTPDGTGRLVFLAAPDGRRYLATDGPAYELVPATATAPTNLLVLLGIAVAALSALVLPAGWVLRRLRRRPARATAVWRTARALAAGSALAGLGFLGALFATLTGNTDDFLYRVPTSFALLLAVPVVGLAAAAVATALTVGGWRGSGAGVAARVHQVVLLLGLAAFTWFGWQWNLIGWQYH